MKKTIINVLAMFIVTGIAIAQQQTAKGTLDKKYWENVTSIETTINTLYGVISGEKGEDRNWELFRYLFHPNAKMVASGKNRVGLIAARFITDDEYIELSGQMLVENGFYEEELNRVTEQFGSLAHVLSTYQSFHSKKDIEPFMRGINSIQLMFDTERWWIINIYWTQETPSNPIPKKYLPKRS
ncbi:MAG: hypothetical protein CBB72_012440 [Muricauda sp. TMED12]|nr:MAG: hypothetical protein CBB72_012440 [Muricauda sp. TMED12]